MGGQHSPNELARNRTDNDMRHCDYHLGGGGAAHQLLDFAVACLDTYNDSISNQNPHSESLVLEHHKAHLACLHAVPGTTATHALRKGNSWPHLDTGWTVHRRSHEGWKVLCFVNRLLASFIAA